MNLDSLIYEAGRRGILPLTSVCNTGCIFCSHRQNPPEVESFSIKPRQRSEVVAGLDFLGQPRKIVIGESVTRVMEGEPFTHPEIMEILAEVRRRFPLTQIEITTNATLVNHERARELAALGSVRLIVSLNSLGDDSRRRLMGDRVPGRARRGLEAIEAAGLEYEGSLVAMPWVTGWEDLEATVLFLAGGSARTVRVFIPGFTRLAPEHLRFPSAFTGDLARWVKDLRRRTDTPISLEPPQMDDLDPVLVGSVPDSPARKAGLGGGCRILSLDGRAPRSRVEAHAWLEAAADPVVRYHWGSIPEQEARLIKPAGAPSGAVFEYDIDLEPVERVWRKILNRRARRPLVLTSELGRAIVARALEALAPPGAPPAVVEAVPNRFFGGTIGAAGLLTVEDFLDWWFAKTPYQAPGPDLVLVPGLAFDGRGRDLTGRSYLDLEEAMGVPVEEVEP